MKKGEKELLLIKASMKSYLDQVKKAEGEKIYQCGFQLVQKVKKPVLFLIENNIRKKEVIDTMTELISLVIQCGIKCYQLNAKETVRLSVFLNYCCFLTEEFNLSKEISDILSDTYNEWYTVEESL
jgi:hypothetical protein